MKIIYTVHALEQMQERKIHPLWVEETIKYADQTIRDDNKYYALKRLGSRMLKVVYVKENYIKVVTTFFIQ